MAAAPGEDLVASLDVAVPELHLAPLRAHLGLEPAEERIFRMRLVGGAGEASPR